MALMHVNFFSQSLGMAVAVDVVLPQKANRQIGMAAETRAGKHPVLWLLHGASDNHTVWGRRTSIERYAANLGLAVVMPNGHLSSYTNMAYGGKYFDYIALELPQVMRGFFPLSEKREDNYIAGLSMGGAGCMKVGLAYPENYAAIGCLSAGIGPIDPKDSPFANNPEWQRRMIAVNGNIDRAGTLEDPMFQAKRIVEEGRLAPRVFHSCGADDFARNGALKTKEFFEGFEGDPFDYTYQECPGAHTWEYWDEHIQDFLAYIGLSAAADIHN